MLKTGGIEPHWLVSFLSDACEASWTASSDGYVLDIPEWRNFTGQTQAEVEGDGWANAVHPDDQARALAAWRNAVAEGSIYSCAYRVRYLDGKYRRLFSIGTPIRKRDGTIYQWFGASFRLPESATNEPGFAHANPEDVSAGHLKAARAALGWSIKTMSEKSGLSPMTLRRLEGEFPDIKASSSSLEKALTCFADNGITMLKADSCTVVAIEQPEMAKAKQASSTDLPT